MMIYTSFIFDLQHIIYYRPVHILLGDWHKACWPVFAPDILCWNPTPDLPCVCTCSKSLMGYLLNTEKIYIYILVSFNLRNQDRGNHSFQKLQTTRGVCRKNDFPWFWEHFSWSLFSKEYRHFISFLQNGLFLWFSPFQDGYVSWCS